ncbi:MAG: beta-lactamase family protein [Armatimonadetes bacterium]|nr:beta-lactamase family protein [Armatimonadota bacterium]MDE2206800.1 beta-lactamase family protein [Armatimonadota bacterium]
MTLSPGKHPAFDWRGRIPTSGEREPRFLNLDRTIRACMRRHGTTGCAVALMAGEDCLYRRAFGWSEVGARPFLATTPCRVASISKSLTGAAALRLVDEGRLDLDALALPLLMESGIAPASLPGRMPDPRLGAIRIRDLLDHATGFPRSAPYTTTLEMAAALRSGLPLLPADVVRYSWGATDLAAAPGRAFEYANINFVTVGRILEIITGEPYPALVRRLVLDPAGIGPGEAFVSTNMAGPGDPREAGYYQFTPNDFPSLLPGEDGRIGSEPYGGFDPNSMDASGGWALSLDALYRFAAAVEGDRLFGARAIQALTTPPDYLAGEAGGYTLDRFYSKGFVLYRPPAGVRHLEHAGMLQHASAYYGPAGGLQLVFVANCNRREEPWLDRVLREAIMNWLPEANAGAL